VGISEDLWAVTQTTHNAIALGQNVKFVLSRAMWHKIRETWSHAEWLASFPRWAGGYIQMLHDPLMQRITDFGPQTVFAREIRSQSGRMFFSAPVALLHILSMPLAILLDLTPFVQILLVLWNLGFIFNQVLTVHGLNSYLEGAGFNRVCAILGGIAAAVGCWLSSAAQPFAPGIILLSFLAGGFFVGLSRWLSTRFRDMLLFGPQLVLHTLGQLVRLSLEFTVSGASPEDAKSVNMAFRSWVGPREDRPLDRFPNFLNMRTIVWLIGVPYFALGLLALYHLDLLNVLLLFPLLCFSVSVVAGPFLLKPPIGRPLGALASVPRLLGWMAAWVFYSVVSLLIAAGGRAGWLGSLLLLGVFGSLLGWSLRYRSFRHRLSQAQKKLVSVLGGSGLQSKEAEALTAKTIQLCLGDVSQVSQELNRARLPAEQQTSVLSLVNETLVPLLRATQPSSFPANRWVSDFGRNFVVALLVFIWFLIVPVPGRILMTAGAYHFIFGLDKLLLGIALLLVGILLSAALGALVQSLEWRFGLKPRIERAFAQLRSLPKSPREGTSADRASAYALLTDTQTYLDQYNYAYAHRALKTIENVLGAQATNS
jgi:hypothetical protein